MIKLNSFWLKMIPFDQIESYELVDQGLRLVKNDGRQLTFGLAQVRHEDKERLNEMLRAHTIADVS